MEMEPAEVRKLFTQGKRAKLKTFPHFPKDLAAPDKRGVYIIYAPQDPVCHVGCSPRGKRGLYQRLRNHMDTQSSFTNSKLKWHGKKLRGRYKFRYLVVEHPRHRMLLECLAIGSLCPLHIGVHKSKKA